MEEKIIDVIDENGGRIDGAENLTLRVTTSVSAKWWVLQLLRRLQRAGRIEIIHSTGGRGNKTVYKRNRNSPGQPRKVKHE